MIASLSIVLAFCRLDVPDLAGWFPGMTSPDVFLAKVSEQLIWCIMKSNYLIEESSEYPKIHELLPYCVLRVTLRTTRERDAVCYW
jgi:hypothetical protein